VTSSLFRAMTLSRPFTKAKDKDRACRRPSRTTHRRIPVRWAPCDYAVLLQFRRADCFVQKE
jgi:hypothetical protein